jgi:hypothetical protein
MYVSIGISVQFNDGFERIQKKKKHRNKISGEKRQEWNVVGKNSKRNSSSKI